MVPKKKMLLIEKKIKSKCRDCEDGFVCTSCKATIARCKKYDYSGVPMDYWMLPFKDFKGDRNFRKRVSSYIEDINLMYENGSSLAFVGNFGTGKTYVACCILKLAIVNNYSGKYVNMSDIIDESTKNNSKIFEKITNVDFLVIDEFCDRWVYPSEKAEQLFGQTMERILRQRFQNKMPTIICSNTTNLKDVLAGDFSRSIDSLFSKYMETMYVSGKDFRKAQR